MSDIHIYLEREQPVKAITLEPTGARGPVGPQGPAGPTGPNSVTSATTSDGTADLSLSSISMEEGDVMVSISKDEISFTSGTLFTKIDAGGLTTTESVNIGDPELGSVTLTAFGDGIFSSGVTSPYYGVTPGGNISLASTNEGGVISINGEAATDARTVAFPDASGTVALFDGSGNLTVSGTLFANHIHGNIAGNVYTHVRAGESLTKGDPVYISGSHGTAPNIVPIVMRADASNAAKMPAIGIVDADIANNANGHAVITGVISDINTNAYAVNTVLYVASGGSFTSTPPAANSQPVAIVERSNTNNGAVIVKVNGLASSGGNGASDANKLVRFSSTGTIPVASIGGLGTGVATALAINTGSAGAFVVNGGTATDMTFAGTAAFTSTTRPTSAGTGTPAATSLMTRDDVDARGGRVISVTLPTDEAGDANTTTLKTSATLQMTLEVGTWDIDCLIIVNCNNTTAGCGQKLNFAGTSSSFLGVFYAGLNGATTSTSYPSFRVTGVGVDANYTAAGSSVSTVRFARLVVTASGVLSAQFAQRTATAGTSPTLVAGSYLRARKVS